MSERSLVDCFETSDEFVTTLSSSNREMRRYEREKKFIDMLVSGDPEPNKQGLYPGELSRKDIVNAMVKAGLVKNPNTFLGRLQVSRNLSRVHKTNYWAGYYFVRLTQENTDFGLYKVRRDDVSGLPY